MENNLFPSGCYCSARSGCSCSGSQLAQPSPSRLANGYTVETRPVPSPPPHAVLSTARFLPALAFHNTGEMVMGWLLDTGPEPDGLCPGFLPWRGEQGWNVGGMGLSRCPRGQVPVLQPNSPRTLPDSPHAVPTMD